jgi:hypothetical protein
MIMKRAKQRAPSVHHFLFSLAKILARISFPFGGSTKLAAARLAITNTFVKRFAIREPPAQNPR